MADEELQAIPGTDRSGLPDREHDGPRPPVVYSCSGCSSAAQMANHVALALDEEGVAEMSCIAGVGGKVPALLRVAHAGRPIVALDGCVLACVRQTLAQEGITPDEHIRLDLMGVRKLKRTRFDAGQARDILAQVRSRLLPGQR